MADLVPISGAPAQRNTGSVLTALTDSAGGSAGQRLKAFAAQPAIRRSLPAAAVLASLTGVALLWLALSDPPQRVLYGSLTDAERAEVVA